jgi:hypothetical protein
MPSPLHALFYLLLTSLLAATLYTCVQGVVMIYDLYQILQWVRELAERG